MSLESEILKLIESNNLSVTTAAGTPLDVREFSVRQAMSELFTIEVTAVSHDLDVDLDAAVGLDASFAITLRASTAAWTGICVDFEQIRVDEAGLATYHLVIRPALWKLTQRTNYRIFQYLSELDIVQKILGEWGIAFESRCAGDSHKPRKYRVQYGESDFDFVARMLEDAGITFFFETGDDGTMLVLDDAPESRGIGHAALRFHDEPGVTDSEFVTKLAARSRLRPGAMTMGDVDYRLPSTSQPRLGANGGLPQEAALEQFDHEPGAFLYQAAASGKTPFADDRGAARTDTAAGARKVENRLAGHRNDARIVSFESDLLELRPGQIASVVNHPHSLVTGGLLVVRATVAGVHSGTWRVAVDSAPTSQPYRPAPACAKPRVRGIESATVVGPKAEEIHTDEYGRVRVHFHWDRESKRNEESSCWLPVNQPWSGDGYGAVNLPRVGQEVLVGFLGGDPDRPVVTGRVYTEMNPVPDPLPQYKHVAGIFSESTPRLVLGGAVSPQGSGPASIFKNGTPMTPSEMNANASEGPPFQVTSPTNVNHTWLGSGMKLDDNNGAENLYIQANKDMHWVVRNDWVTVVGAERTARIGTDDITWVDGNQSIYIGADQATLVQKSQANRVDGKRIDTVGDKFTQTTFQNLKVSSTTESIEFSAKEAIEFDAKITIEFRVSKSVVKIQKNMIAASSEQNHVELNPLQNPDTPEAAQRRTEQTAANAIASTSVMSKLWNGTEQAQRNAMADAGITDKADQDAALARYNGSSGGASGGW